jgi:hypothetical protein
MGKGPVFEFAVSVEVLRIANPFVLYYNMRMQFAVR